MYVENKDGEIDEAGGRIGWVSFSKTGKTVYYRGRDLLKSASGVRGNVIDVATGENIGFPASRSGARTRIPGSRPMLGIQSTPISSLVRTWRTISSWS